MQGVTCCRRAMYGLLQLLPQSDAFRTLHARLHAAPTAALLQLSPPPSEAGNGAPEKSPAEVTAAPWLASVQCSWWYASLYWWLHTSSSLQQAAAAKQIGFDRLLEHFIQRQVGHCMDAWPRVPCTASKT
jgi:hypothetical protein